MVKGHADLQRSERAAWRAIGGIAIAVTGLAWLAGFALDLRSFALPAATTALLAAAAWFYQTVRDEARLSAMLAGTAQIIGFAAVAAPLSYFAAALGLPLQDPMLEAWDRHLGFDWTQWMSVVAWRPGLRQVLLFAYSSFAMQTVTTVLALGLVGQLRRLRTFIEAFIATSLITIAVSAVCPAAGPWLFLKLHPAMANGFLPLSSTSWPVFLGLRDGTVHTVYGLNSEGIITFPSLHAALGVLFPAALWRVRKLRWIALTLNGLLLLATPVYGSHYIVDVAAGILVAAACWFAVAPRFAVAATGARDHATMIHAPVPIVPQASPPREALRYREMLDPLENKIPAA